MEYLATNVLPKRLIINEISIMKSPLPRFSNLKNAQNAPKIFLKMHQKTTKDMNFTFLCCFFLYLANAWTLWKICILTFFWRIVVNNGLSLCKNEGKIVQLSHLVEAFIPNTVLELCRVGCIMSRGRSYYVQLSRYYVEKVVLLYMRRGALVVQK